jgi:hypothetical protein
MHRHRCACHDPGITKDCGALKPSFNPRTRICRHTSPALPQEGYGVIRGDSHLDSDQKRHARMGFADPIQVCRKDTRQCNVRLRVFDTRRLPQRISRDSTRVQYGEVRCKRLWQAGIGQISGAKQDLAGKPKIVQVGRERPGSSSACRAANAGS